MTESEIAGRLAAQREMIHAEVCELVLALARALVKHGRVGEPELAQLARAMLSDTEVQTDTGNLARNVAHAIAGDYGS